MASARCYSKSGSIEKYESNLWGIESGGVAVTITGPDSSGNYTVTPQSEYEDSNTPTQFYFTTIYGGVRKTFYFKESIKEIWIWAGIGHQEKDLLVVYLAFGNNEYLGNDKLEVKVEITVNNPTALIDSVFFTVDKNSQPSLVKRLYRDIDINRIYRAKIISCSPMSGRNYRVTIRSHN